MKIKVPKIEGLDMFVESITLQDGKGRARPPAPITTTGGAPFGALTNISALNMTRWYSSTDLNSLKYYTFDKNKYRFKPEYYFRGGNVTLLTHLINGQLPEHERMDNMGSGFSFYGANITSGRRGSFNNNDFTSRVFKQFTLDENDQEVPEYYDVDSPIKEVKYATQLDPNGTEIIIPDGGALEITVKENATVLEKIIKGAEGEEDTILPAYEYQPEETYELLISLETFSDVMRDNSFMKPREETKTLDGVSRTIKWDYTFTSTPSQTPTLATPYSAEFSELHYINNEIDIFSPSTIDCHFKGSVNAEFNQIQINEDATDEEKEKDLLTQLSIGRTENLYAGTVLIISTLNIRIFQANFNVSVLGDNDKIEVTDNPFNSGAQWLTVATSDNFFDGEKDYLVSRVYHYGTSDEVMIMRQTGGFPELYGKGTVPEIFTPCPDFLGLYGSNLLLLRQKVADWIGANFNDYPFGNIGAIEGESYEGIISQRTLEAIDQAGVLPNEIQYDFGTQIGCGSADGVYNLLTADYGDKLFLALRDGSGYYDFDLSEIMEAVKIPNGYATVVGVSFDATTMTAVLLIDVNDDVDYENSLSYVARVYFDVPIPLPKKFVYDFKLARYGFIPCQTRYMGKGGIISKV